MYKVFWKRNLLWIPYWSESSRERFPWPKFQTLYELLETFSLPSLLVNRDFLDLKGLISNIRLVYIFFFINSTFYIFKVIIGLNLLAVISDKYKLIMVSLIYKVRSFY